MNSENFAPLFRRALEQRAMTRRQLARQIGVSANTVSSWSNGTHLPRANHLSEIATALEIDLDELAESASRKPSADVRAADSHSASIVLRLAQLEVEPLVEALAGATPELLDVLREATAHAKRLKTDDAGAS